MILFLDFDGVLHSSNQDGPLFLRVPALAMWLQAWPDVDVVISSSWRMAHSQQEMVEMLGPIVGNRIVGCTPWAPQERDDNVYPATKTTVFTHERQVQVETWMASSWDPDRAWVALDDMPYLFEADCGRLVVCPGRQGLSRENVQTLNRHAERAGLARSGCRGAASGMKPVIHAVNEAEEENRMQTFDKFLKHTGSCLPDCMFRVTVDRERCQVTIASAAFDSHLVGWLVTQVLPEGHGIKAFREDDSAWNPPPAAYDLRVRIGGESGVDFGCEVVRLSSAVGGGVAVRLSEPRQLIVGED